MPRRNERVLGSHWNKAEIAGALGVIITLIYLSSQVRQANLHAISQSRQRLVVQTHSEL